MAKLEVLAFYVKNFGVRQGFEMYKYLGVENLPNGVISWLQADMADGDSSVDDLVEGGSDVRKLFRNQSLLEEHYAKHGQEIVDILDDPNYSIDKYLDDANYIINNGTYVPELNGYISFMNGKNYGFVGLDSATGYITTFHIKSVSELIKKAPSLGFER